MTTLALWRGWCCGAATVSTDQRLRSHTFTTQVNFRTVILFALAVLSRVLFLKSNSNSNTNTNTNINNNTNTNNSIIINNINMGTSMISSQVTSHLRPSLDTWLSPLHLRDLRHFQHSLPAAPALRSALHL